MIAELLLHCSRETCYCCRRKTPSWSDSHGLRDLIEAALDLCFYSNPIHKPVPGTVELAGDEPSLWQRALLFITKNFALGRKMPENWLNQWCVCVTYDNYGKRKGHPKLGILLKEKLSPKFLPGISDFEWPGFDRKVEMMHWDFSFYFLWVIDQSWGIHVPIQKPLHTQKSLRALVTKRVRRHCVANQVVLGLNFIFAMNTLVALSLPICNMGIQIILYRVVVWLTSSDDVCKVLSTLESNI